MENSKKVLLGQKRRRSAGQSKLQSCSVKKRKTGVSAAKTIVSVAAAQTKIGKTNPSVEIISEEREKSGVVSSIIKGCCTRCNNRNVHRATTTGNKALLAKCIFDLEGITNLNAAWGPDCRRTPLELLLKYRHMDLLEGFLKPKIPAKKSKLTYDELRSNLFEGERKSDETQLLSIINTGRVSRHAYGSRVRAVEMTRGNRQGNNAFEEIEDGCRNVLEQLQEDLPCDWVRDGYFGVSEFQMLEKLMSTEKGFDLKQDWSDSVMDLIKLGQYKLPIYMIKELVKHSHYNFNELHLNCLKKYKSGEKLPDFKFVSVAKKGNSGVTPLHFACINPDIEVLKQVLAVNNDINLQDQSMRRPIHYAAACEGTGPLQYLIEKGANVLDVDLKKTSCLHLAIKAKRLENVKIILGQGDGKGAQLLKMRDQKGINAMGMACEISDTAIIQELIKFGAQVNQGVGKDRMQPLGWAAASGNYELCEWLIENKARVVGFDKYKRTPLTMAVRNGHLKVASLLLRKGSDWNQTDSSSNSPLHYAAAFGWSECIDLLIKTGADVNAANSWRMTPINIAMLKNHEGIVKKFLNFPNVNVNCQDERGRTLLTMSLLDISERTPSFIKYLLEKGANPNIQDIDGQTTMHYLANIDVKAIKRDLQDGFSDEELDETEEDEESMESEQDESDEEEEEEDEDEEDEDEEEEDKEELQRKIKNRTILQRKLEIQLEIADILLKYNASLDHMDHNKHIPFALALKHGNINLLEKLSDKVSLNKHPQLLHALSGKIIDQRYQKLLEKLISNDSPNVETMNQLDENGLTPFLAYIYMFCSSYKDIKGKIMTLINQEALAHKTSFHKYSVDLALLFPSIRKKKQKLNKKSQQKVQLIIPIDKLKEMVDKKFQEHIVKPFLEILDLIVQNGAATNSTVQKLKKFRDAQIIVEGGTKQERIKKRELLMKELGVTGRNKSKYLSKEDKVKLKNKENEKVENEYHENIGKQNAFHLAVNFPEPQLIKLLLKFRINFDLQDQKLMTPFNLLSSQVLDDDSTINNYQTQFGKTLLSQKAQYDIPDHKGRTAFLNYFANGKVEEAYELLKRGGNVNQIDATGLYALKYALIRRDSAQITTLVEKYKSNINLIDHKKRNCLHHAINMSSATADASFETEQLLIDLGVNVNQCDYHNRTPLHYAFVKMKDWSNNSQIDPIETVSSICAVKGLQINVADKWNRTPLHYASQRGASICSMYLNKRGADIEAIDIYGNTPLGVALLSGHHNFSIIMIQNASNVNKLVHKIDPAKLERMWRKERGDSDNEEMQDEDEKHRHVFEAKNKLSESDGYGSEEKDSEEGSEPDSDQEFEKNAFNKQNAFNQKVFSKGTSGNQIETQGESDEPKSMFRISIAHGQQGLAYLMMDQGYNMMRAIKDALEENKFQLVITLLSKIQDNKIVCQKTEEGKNLMHILGQTASKCEQGLLRRIYGILKKRGVKCQERDAISRTALHYASLSRSRDLVDILLKEGANAQSIDKLGHTPLTLYMKGPEGAKTLLFNQHTGEYDKIFDLLLKSKASINQLYPEDSIKPGYKTTILINMIRQTLTSKTKTILSQNLQALVQRGAKFDIVDTDGRDVMAHAVMGNSLSVVRFLIANKKVGLLHNSDKEGKSAAHFVVNPCVFGSYENVKILMELKNAGFPMKNKDSAGKEPLDYAKHQQSGILFKALAGMTNRKHLQADLKKKSAGQQIAAAVSEIDFEKDAASFMKEALKKEMVDVDKLKKTVPVDETGQFEKSYSVHCEGQQPWDVYLTKVDLKNGIYGDYVFYKLQMLYDSIRDLYVVFTRWGRIGEDGMNQRTPFVNVEEAKKDFCSIFKAKTGNDFLDLKNFKKINKKYQIAQVKYTTVNHQDYLAPFDFKNCPKSKLENNKRVLLEEVANITMYQKAMSDLGIDNGILPISNLNKQVVQKARSILKEIGTALKKDLALCKKGMGADLDKLLEVRNKIQELSSRYYEIIPQSKYNNQIPPPIAADRLLTKEFDTISKLGDIEQASRILLGALYRQSEIHPIDYLSSALGIKMEYLAPDSNEQAVIEEYIRNTSETKILDTHRVKVFQLQEPGESTQELREYGNRRLLYHGSSLFNFVGILSQGLRIAPPEAPATGYMFGKGVYFADMFSKSKHYSSSRISKTQNSTLMLLCDVALGNIQQVLESEDFTKLPPGKDSVHGIGKRGPNYENSLTLPDGVLIPNGEIKKNEISDDLRKGFKPQWAGHQPTIELEHNEFIVYNTKQIKMSYLLQLVKKTDKK